MGSAAVSLPSDHSESHSRQKENSGATSGSDLNASAQKPDGKTKKRRKPKRERRNDEKESTKKDSFVASLGRAMIGTLAFVFKRPVRLFRPVKLSSWNILEAMAKRENRTLGIRYLRTLIRREKSSFLPHLLLPPLVMNAMIGFCLFESYSSTEAALLRRYYPSIPIPAGPFDSTSTDPDKSEPDSKVARAKPNFSPLWIVTISGFVAGAAQCIISAPLDNVRIVLQSPPPPSKKHGTSRSPSPTQSPTLNFSWRAIARAAVLPFAPAISRERLVSKIKESQSNQKTPFWKSILSWNSSSSGKREKKLDQLTNKERRILWEKKLKRWRGGIHGAGLVFSLMRDSFGFASFFLIFEVSRRCAYHASLAADRIQAFSSAGAALPSSTPPPRPSQRSSGSSSSDEFHTESSEMEISDVSFSTSRTISGRVIAALCLIVGGACGAAVYELAGRPFELAREVVWQGRKDWEEGKRKSKEWDKNAWTGGKGRHGTGDLRKRHRTGFVGARVKYRRKVGDTRHRQGLIELRSSNSLGRRNSRIESSFNLGTDRPPHPLRLGKIYHKNIKKKIVGKIRVSKKGSNSNLDSDPRSTSHPTLGPNRKRVLTSSKPSPSPSLSSRSSNQEIKSEMERQRMQAPLSTRPSALTLLIEHSQRTSSLRFVSSNSSTPTPVPIPILLFHTYFLSPFSKNSIQVPSTSYKSSKNSSPKKSSIEDKVRSRWTLNNPVSPAPKNSLGTGWGQGRMMWALKRLSTPYGLGFVLFAYLSGDLT